VDKIKEQTAKKKKSKSKPASKIQDVDLSVCFTSCSPPFFIEFLFADLSKGIEQDGYFSGWVSESVWYQ
jgi:hypothetical protein